MSAPRQHTATLDSSLREMEKYLTSPCITEDKNPLEFWNMHQQEFPALAALAQRYLAVPATSAPVERLFSIGGRIFRPDRCRLTDKTFEHLMNIKVNGPFSH